MKRICTPQIKTMKQIVARELSALRAVARAATRK